MKLRVVELLLVSTLPAMILAQRGIPDLVLTVATLVGGTLAAGSANAFNQVMEQDLDIAMGRTSKRPLVVGSISTQGLSPSPSSLLSYRWESFGYLLTRWPPLLLW